MSNPVVFPGTFDPLTFGHVDVVRRAQAVFGSVIVGVAGSESRKSPLIPLNKRVELAQEVFQDLPSVSVETIDGLLVHWMKKRDLSVIVRGLRNGSDFSGEWQQAGINSTLEPSIETVWLPASSSHAMLASQFVREIIALGGDVGGFVPSPIADWLVR